VRHDQIHDLPAETHKEIETMRTEQKLTIGVTAVTVLGLMATAWMQGRPASAQDDPARATPRGGQGAGGQGGGRMMMMGGGPASIAATGDFIYVLRGNTLYQMKSSDLSLVTQKDLPRGPGRGNGGFPGGGGDGQGGAGNGQ